MTSPSLLADLPEIIAASIKVVMPQLAQCKGMSGRFDIEQIKRLGVSAPAVLISRLRTVQDKTYAGPHVTFGVEMAAFVICKDGLGAGRHEMAGRIAQTLLTLIPNCNWGQPDDIDGATGVQELPLTTKVTDEAGMAVIAVTWSHVISLTSLPLGEAISPEVYLGVAPNIGAAHESEYIQIGGEP